MKKQYCQICQIPLEVYQWQRCDEHKKCDVCGTKEGLVHYTSGIFCQPCREKQVDKIVADFRGNTEYTDVPVCPHCGYKLTDWWDMTWGSDDYKEIKCSRCERDYEIELFRTYEFSTNKSGASDGTN